MEANGAVVTEADHHGVVRPSQLSRVLGDPMQWVGTTKAEAGVHLCAAGGVSGAALGGLRQGMSTHGQSRWGFRQLAGRGFGGASSGGLTGRFSRPPTARGCERYFVNPAAAEPWAVKRMLRSTSA